MRVWAATMAKVAVVTGSNQGIGFECVRLLARGALALAPGSTVFLCSRDIHRGEEALKKIKEEGDTKVELKLAQLDIVDDVSIAKLAETIKRDHGGIDILINNAGFAFKNAATESMSEQAEKTIAINYFGTKAVSKALLPLLKDNARVVNVGSGAGELGKYGANLRERFLDPDLTEEQLDELVAEFKRHVASGDHAAHGWPNSTYSVSKAALHVLTRIHARDIGKFTSSTGVCVNAICPGWCRTSMAGDKAPKSAAEGADTPVWLAEAPPGPDAPTGRFFRERKEVTW